MAAPASAWRRMTTHSSSVSLPGLVRMASGTAILPTSCSRLAWRSVSASAAVRPSTSPTLLAEQADALEVQPGLLVARLGRGGQALDDLQLRLAQLGGALVDGLLERLVAQREAMAPAALGQVAGGDGGHGAEREGEERRRDRQHVAVIEGDLGDDEPGDGRAGREQRGQQRAHAQAGERRQQAEGEDGQQVHPARHVAQRQPVGGGVDRVGLDLGARHELARGGRRRVDVLQRGRRRPRRRRSARARARDRRGR